jgi:hypothetical protein
LEAKYPERLLQIDGEVALMEDFIEEIENDWLDDAAIKQEGDDYKP